MLLTPNANILKFLLPAVFILLYLALPQLRAQEMPSDSTQSSATIVFHLDYDSKALSTGRDFGVPQSVFSSAIAYTHPAGFQGRISGNWFSNSEPRYGLTVLSVGYTHPIGSYWSYTLSYDHSFFNPSNAGLLNKALSVQADYQRKHFNASLQYAFLFGEERAHRVNATFGTYFEKVNEAKEHSLSFSPYVMAVLGTENIPFNRFTTSQFERGTGLPGRNRLRNQTNRPGINRDRDQPIFDLMSWQFSIPLDWNLRAVGIGAAYTYVIPIQLPDEVYESAPKSYFSVSLSYTWSLKTKYK